MRIIVKNIPKGQSNESIKAHFNAKGKVTDVQLKYHKNGNFRHFGFVGFESTTDAENAVNYFNNTYINTNKITVSLCTELWDNPKSAKTQNDIPNVEKKVSKSDEVQELLKKHKDDPLFQEYMSSHKKKGQIWSSDVPLPENFELDVVPPKKEKPKIEEEPTKKKEHMIELFTIKLMNTPANIKRSDVTKFFKPIKVHSIRIPKLSGFCFAGFKTEGDFKKALLKNRSFMKKNQVQIVDYCERNKMSLEKSSSVKEIKKDSRWQKQEDELAKEDGIDESGRIYFRNLPYETTEDDLKEYFEKCGPIADINLPVDADTKRIKGFGTVTFVMPEHALLAYNKLNGVSYHGRLLHLMPAKSRDKPEINLDGLSHKEKKLVLQRQGASNPFNWNTFFMGSNAIAEAVAANYDTSKNDILDTSAGGSSAAVRLALGETEIVNKMKKYLQDNGVSLDAFSMFVTKYSKNTIVVKNLPADTTYDEIKKLFTPFGLISKILLPPNGVTAIVDFVDSSEAKTAYKKLAYKKFKHLPLYLEWAPAEIFASDVERKPINNDGVDERLDEQTEKSNAEDVKHEAEDEGVEEDGDDDEEPEEATTLFLRNLNFVTEENAVRKTFAKIGRIHSIQIAQKKDVDNSGQFISLGYGFIQFKKHEDAEKALRQMPYVNIDGNKVELNRSDRTLKTHGGKTSTRKKTINTEQTGTKLLVRNVPFQAKENEIRDLFKVFGKLKAVRLPQKLTTGEESHRGFGFVEFLTKPDAKKAFEALSESTHLYGRRLVLEWANPEDNVEQLRKRAADHFVGNAKKKSRKGVFEAKKIVFDEDE